MHSQVRGSSLAGLHVEYGPCLVSSRACDRRLIPRMSVPASPPSNIPAVQPPSSPLSDAGTSPGLLNPKFQRRRSSSSPLKLGLGLGFGRRQRMKQLTVQIERSGEHGYGLVLDHDIEATPQIWIDDVLGGSPAHRAMLRRGDQLLRVAGRDVRRCGVDRVLDLLSAASKVKLTVQRPTAEMLELPTDGDGVSGGGGGAAARGNANVAGGSDERAGGGGSGGGGSGTGAWDETEAAMAVHQAHESALKELHDARAEMSQREDQVVRQQLEKRRTELAQVKEREEREIRALRGAQIPAGWSQAVGQWRAWTLGTDIRLSVFKNGVLELMRAEYPRRTVVQACILGFEIDSWGVGTMTCETRGKRLRGGTTGEARRFALELQPPQRRASRAAKLHGSPPRLTMVIDGVCFAYAGAPCAFHKSNQCRKGSFSADFGPR